MRASSLSQWEMDEMAYLRRSGWTVRNLAMWYGMGERSVRRMLREMGCEPIRADSRRSHEKVD